MEETRPIPAWQTTVIEALKANGVRAVGHVPDLVLADLIRQAEADEAFDVYAPAREEEGVGVLSGAYLGGQRGVLLLQNSGVGNLVNALASLAVPSQIPFLMLISERGALHEFNPAQVGMAQCLRPVLDALGVPHVTLSREDEVRPVVDGACALAFSTERPVALVLSPLLTGGKKGLPAYEDEQPAAARSGRGAGGGEGGVKPARWAGPRPVSPPPRAAGPRRADAAPGVRRRAGGRPARGAGGDRPGVRGVRRVRGRRPGAELLPLRRPRQRSGGRLRARGARPADRVVCVDGEGSLLANLGVLATIGRYGPPNLTCVILDNEMFQITGGQATHTAWGTDLALVAAGCGIESAHTVATLEDFRATFEKLLRTPGPHCLVAKVDRQRSAGYQPRKGVLLKYRFMGALGTHPDVGALAWE